MFLLCSIAFYVFDWLLLWTGICGLTLTFLISRLPGLKRSFKLNKIMVDTWKKKSSLKEIQTCPSTKQPTKKLFLLDLTVYEGNTYKHTLTNNHWTYFLRCTWGFCPGGCRCGQPCRLKSCRLSCSPLSGFPARHHHITPALHVSNRYFPPPNAVKPIFASRSHQIMVPYSVLKC